MKAPAITVYCSSSRHVAEMYFALARGVGTAIATAGYTLVYGGNDLGCMGALADAARAAGGEVVGVTPQHFVDQGFGDALSHELIVTTTMRERKRVMDERADAFIVLPGGMGTLEEFFEILVSRSLGLHGKPIVLVNAFHFFDPLLAMLQSGIEQRFIRDNALTHLHIAHDADEAMAVVIHALEGK